MRVRILGIDPGIAIVGFGLIEADRGKTRLLNYGAITTPAGLPLARRLVQIEQDMEALIAQLKPDAIAVEELFFSNNITTGIAVAHGRGIILCTAEKSGVPLYEYTPMQVKQGGVGYACKTTSTTISQLQVGKASKLYTYLHVGEGIFDLYGFATQGELGSFKQLIGISGVGPKAALAILSVCTPQELAMAVITGDEKALIAAPGIGKKIAQRIILELKDKLAKEQQEIGMPTAPGIVAGEKSKAVEAAAALAVLGYTQQDIAVAMKGVDVENLPLEEIVRQSLKKMVK